MAAHTIRNTTKIIRAAVKIKSINPFPVLGIPAPFQKIRISNRTMISRVKNPAPIYMSPPSPQYVDQFSRVD